MEKIENNENKISLKDIIGWIIAIFGIISSLISTNFFANDKDSNILFKALFISLIASSSISFIEIKIFSDKTKNNLFNSLLKEVKTRKNLERQKEKLEESLESKKMFLFREKEQSDKLEKKNEKTENERNQLMLVLASCGILKKDVGIDENISSHEWEKKPGIKEKIEEITNKWYKKWLESEHTIFNLSDQLEDKKVPWWEQKLGDKRWKEKVINSVEGHWKYRSHIKADTNNEIEGKTIEEILTKHWREHLQSKKGKGIIEEGRRLIKLIDDFTSKHLRKIN